MQATHNFPVQIMRVLISKGLVRRFNQDMLRLFHFAAVGDTSQLNAESARVMAWIAEAVGMTPSALQSLLLVSAPAPDPRHLMVPIANRLFTERERLGLNREQLADIGGVTPGDQRDYESGCSTAPPSYYLAQIARDAGIDVLYVLTGRREGAQPHA